MPSYRSMNNMVADVFVAVCKFVLVSSCWNQFTEGLREQSFNTSQITTVSQNKKWISDFRESDRNSNFGQTAQKRLSTRSKPLLLPSIFSSVEFPAEDLTTTSSLKSDVHKFENISSEQLPSNSRKNITQHSDRQNNIRSAASVKDEELMHQENITNKGDERGEYKEREAYDQYDESDDDEQNNIANEEDTDEYDVADYTDTGYDEEEEYDEQDPIPDWPRVFNYSDSGTNEIRRLPIGGTSSEPAINISLVVIYSWLGLVIIMIAITILVFKYKQKLSATCWRSTCHCRNVRKQETTIEEGNNLLTHPLM